MLGRTVPYTELTEIWNQLHDKFTKKLSWIDENVVGDPIVKDTSPMGQELTRWKYQEIFSISQALSGPASTKMLYCINLLHDGFLAAVLGFLFWRYVLPLSSAYAI
jgi:hypothetical protein